MAKPTLVQMAKNQSVYPTNPLTVTLPAKCTAGNYLVITVEGAKVTSPFSNPQDTNGSLAGVTSLTTGTTPTPTLKDDLGNTYTVLDSKVNYDGDLGYWNTLYTYVAKNIGTQQSFTFTDVDATVYGGRPTFTHGLNMQVMEFSGCANAVPDDHKAAVSSANPAVAGAMTLTVTGDLIVVVGTFRKAGSVSVPTGFAPVDSDRLAGTANDYYVIAMSNGELTSASATITNLSLTSNVVTIAAANTFEVGAKITLSGLTTTTALNGTVITAKTGTNATTIVADLTHADIASGAETGKATGGPALLATGSYNPGFVNPSQFKGAIATVAIKHS